MVTSRSATTAVHSIEKQGKWRCLMLSLMSIGLLLCTTNPSNAFVLHPYSNTPQLNHHPTRHPYLHPHRSSTISNKKCPPHSPLPISPTNDDTTTNHPQPPTRRKKREIFRKALRNTKFILPLFLSILTFRHAPHPTHAMGPNLRGPVIEQELRGMPLARIQANELARKQIAEERAKIDEEASKIFKEEGPEAHAAFLKKVEEERVAKVAQRKIDRKELIRRLILEEGEDPWRSLKGKAVLYEFDHGINLYEVQGTPQEAFENLKKVFPDRYNDQSIERERMFMKKQVKDMLEEGKTEEDVVEFFRERGEKMDKMMSTELGRETMKLQTMREEKKMKTKRQEEGMAEEVSVREDGVQQKQQEAGVGAAEVGAVAVGVTGSDEASVKAQEKAEAKAAKQKAREEEKAAKQNAREEARAEKLKAKEEARAERAQKKAEAKAAKEKAREEARIAKEEAKSAKETARTASLAAAGAASVTASAIGSAAGAAGDAVATLEKPTTATDSDSPGGTGTEQPTPSSSEVATTSDSTSIFSSPYPKIVAASTVVGGSGYYAIRVMKSRADKEEEERQKQFNLLMGLQTDAKSTEASTELDMDSQIDDESPTTQQQPSTPPPPTPTPSPPPKKKRGGIGSIFHKSKSNRPSSLSTLHQSDALAPQYAKTISEILSLGAPGRFPSISCPYRSFNQTQREEILKDERAKADLTPEQSAELFACVVNCMLIDIIDLASSALKEKDELVVDGMNVVLDFMDYSAQFFDTVVGNVTITPVTYGGTLPKSKLEQMFSIYALSTMTNFDMEADIDDMDTLPDNQDRVDTLQQVLDISDKRAEGILQKMLMNNMMKMMKDGGGADGAAGMEGLAEMMAGGGLPGGGGPEGEVSPEELQQSVSMMKDLVDSGDISKEEIKIVREQFKQAYGMDIEELIKQADDEMAKEELGEDGRELLDLFKTVLKKDT